MNCLHAGFARVDATPPMGIPIKGYYVPRFAEGVLDPLQINALALRCHAKTVVLLTLDNCGIKQDLAGILRSHVANALGVQLQYVHLHTTHTHTAPTAQLHTGNELVDEYIALLKERMAEAARLAVCDLRPAKMGVGEGIAPNIAFVRRFIMADGSIRTNPGVNNPDIVQPVGQVDERVHLLRFDREDGDSLLLVNFGNHPDTVGGCKISGDWPNFVRRTVEKVLDHTKCIFFNGAQGDVNHVNVHPKTGDMNGMFLDFDDVARGYAHARHIGNVVTGAVLQAFEKVAYRDVNSINALSKPVQIPANLPTPQQLIEAKRIHLLHAQGRDHELAYEGMMLTTVVAEAERMVALEHGPEHFSVELSAIAIGDVALLCIPGEPFTKLGVEAKLAQDWAWVLPFALTNGSEGYFPTMDAYEQGGYEARSSPFRAGVSELLLENGLQLLTCLHKKQEESNKT